MSKKRYAAGEFFSVNIARVQESLERLADNIAFIATGKADDVRNDYEAWERRKDAGVQFVRLRAALNNGTLDRADCDLATLGVLRNCWSAIKMLGYGDHHKRPEEYRGPLFLPHEVGPREAGSPFRKADDPYPDYEGLASEERLRRLRENPQFGHLFQKTTTKRESWAYFPDELRRLSARLASAGNSVRPAAGAGADDPEKPVSRLNECNPVQKFRDYVVHQRCCLSDAAREQSVDILYAAIADAKATLAPLRLNAIKAVGELGMQQLFIAPINELDESYCVWLHAALPGQETKTTNDADARLHRAIWQLKRVLDCWPDQTQQPSRGYAPASDGTADSEGKGQGAAATGEPPKGENPASTATHAIDYHSFYWHGTTFFFTNYQAAAVKILWEHFRSKTPDVGQKAILSEIESDSERLVSVFDNGKHPAWGTMIVSGKTKGTYRIADEPAKKPRKSRKPTAKKK